jgi:ribosome-binding protein aMBF1 (putative translation factor)
LTPVAPSITVADDRHMKPAAPKKIKPKRAAKPSNTDVAERSPVRESEVVKVFARSVKHHREKLGQSQAAFGSPVGLDQANLNLIENARANRRSRLSAKARSIWPRCSTSLYVRSTTQKRNKQSSPNIRKRSAASWTELSA